MPLLQSQPFEVPQVTFYGPSDLIVVTQKPHTHMFDSLPLGQIHGQLEKPHLEAWVFGMSLLLYVYGSQTVHKHGSKHTTFSQLGHPGIGRLYCDLTCGGRVEVRSARTGRWGATAA